jgi:hypothetical protein
MNPAAQAVIHTPELLEAILLELDMETLLVCAQRVCQLWNEVIGSSRGIQEYLYFQPRRTTPWNDLELNPLVFNKLPITMMGKAHAHWESMSHVRRAARPNGYTRMVCRDRSVWTSEDKFVRLDASWRRMLVVQPVSKPCLGGLKPVSTESSMEALTFLAVHEELMMDKIVAIAHQGEFRRGELFGVRLLIRQGNIQVWGDGKDFKPMRRGGYVTIPRLSIAHG